MRKRVDNPNASEDIFRKDKSLAILGFFSLFIPILVLRSSNPPVRHYSVGDLILFYGFTIFWVCSGLFAIAYQMVTLRLDDEGMREGLWHYSKHVAWKDVRTMWLSGNTSRILNFEMQNGKRLSINAGEYNDPDRIYILIPESIKALRRSDQVLLQEPTVLPLTILLVPDRRWTLAVTSVLFFLAGIATSFVMIGQSHDQSDKVASILMGLIIVLASVVLSSYLTVKTTISTSGITKHFFGYKWTSSYSNIKKIIVKDVSTEPGAAKAPVRFEIDKGRRRTSVLIPIKYKDSAISAICRFVPAERIVIDETRKIEHEAELRRIAVKEASKVETVFLPNKYLGYVTIAYTCILGGSFLIPAFLSWSYISSNTGILAAVVFVALLLVYLIICGISMHKSVVRLSPDSITIADAFRKWSSDWNDVKRVRVQKTWQGRCVVIETDHKKHKIYPQVRSNFFCDLVLYHAKSHQIDVEEATT